MRYSFACTLDSQILYVTANNDREAIEKLFMEIKNHYRSVHPTVAMPSEKDIRKDITSRMIREEKKAV